ncbi:hypothetical protein 19_00016 [Pseudomonas phage Epa19]|nr:hypothetical protein 19_00016 [Pseudomonas phage Epa19]
MARFEDQVRRFGRTTMERIDKTRRASTLELFRLIIVETPVDDGVLRNNWRTQVNGPNTDSLDSEDQSGARALAEAAANLGELKDTVFFTNNLPYAERIEYDGWSRFKAPQGMVRKNVVRWDDIVAAKAREYM